MGRTSCRRIGQTLMGIQIVMKWSYFLENPVVHPYLPVHSHVHITDQTIISLAAFGDPVPHVEKEQFESTSVCLMEESLSITMETLEPLDPSSSPTLEIPRNTMKRRNPYLIKFPPLRLTRYLNSISLSVHEM